MKINIVEQGELPIIEWIKVKLKEYHEEKFGEKAEIIYSEEDKK